MVGGALPSSDGKNGSYGTVAVGEEGHITSDGCEREVKREKKEKVFFMRHFLCGCRNKTHHSFHPPPVACIYFLFF